MRPTKPTALGVHWSTVGSVFSVVSRLFYYLACLNQDPIFSAFEGVRCLEELLGRHWYGMNIPHPSPVTFLKVLLVSREAAVITLFEQKLSRKVLFSHSVLDGWFPKWRKLGVGIFLLQLVSF
jgi:hypothetical protein